MNPKIFSILKTIHFNCVFAFVFFTFLALSLDQKFEACEPKSCGFGPNISYPFWISEVQESYCGYPNFEITCNYDYPLLKISNDEYFIKNISSTYHSFLVVSAAAYEDEDDTCSTPLHNISLDRTSFNISPGYANLTLLYNCSTQPSEHTYPISCAGNYTGYSFASFHADALESYGNFSLESCNYTVNAPLYVGDNDIGSLVSKNYTELLGIGFFLNWTAQNCSTCQSSGGRCGFENNDFICFCPDGSHDLKSCHDERRGVRLKAIIASICGVSGALIGLTVVCYIRRRIKSHVFLMSFLQSEKLNNHNIEAFMRNYGSLVPTRHSYADVKRITNSFKEKLGQGGYGSVYKGKLPDGRLVAVKILNESKGNGEEFINEVASISRTSHVNIVSLLGFCLERHKRALIYEFMLNGSLDKFIGSEGQHLEWEKLYQIAVGVARGLEYLHRGCNTRIVHFDIKPHNILLDEDFCPKISDFGLAKICTRKESILSMLEARGTIGYIAPEVFSRNFGGVSHKSDVYSYGMVLLDMVGEKRKDDGIASDASEKYFPYWVYKHLELNKFGDLGVTAVEDVEIVRKITIVGLWCIQMNPSDRPSMSKIIEMLEGSIEILEIPPIPFLSSSPRSASDSCTLSLA